MQEIELKFLVPVYKLEALKRQVDIKSSVTSQLAAHYFDTPNNTLASSGMALRIRKEGDVWVQTLKTSGDGMASRGEQNNILDKQMAEEAADNGSLYPDLSLYDDLPLAHSVSKPDAKRQSKSNKQTKTDNQSTTLNRQYVTDVKRTTRLIKKDGGIIEVAYDEGKVHHGQDEQITQPIHEIEFELVEGDTSFLFETAQVWCRRYNLCISTVTKAERGGLLLEDKEFADATKADLKQLNVDKKMSKPQFMRAVVHNCLLQILPNASAIAAGSLDGNHVHQLRVGLRRLRTALKFFDGFSEQINPEWQSIIKQTFSLLGEYRDLEVLETKTQPWLESLGGPYVDWSDERDNLKVKPLDAVRANDFQITLLEMIAYTMSPAAEDSANHDGPAKEATSIILNKLYKKISKASDNFVSISIEEQHDVRKRLKSLRYISEFVRPMYKKKKTKKFLQYLEPAQEILGDYNDNIIGHQFYLDKTELEPNAWFAVGYFSAQEQHAAHQCATSLASIKNAPKFW